MTIAAIANDSGGFADLFEGAGVHGERWLASFLVDGELISRLQTTALAFSFPQRVGLDMRHRLPGLLVGLAASLRSMPTAVSEAYQGLIRRGERLQSKYADEFAQG